MAYLKAGAFGITWSRTLENIESKLVVQSFYLQIDPEPAAI